MNHATYLTTDSGSTILADNGVAYVKGRVTTSGTIYEVYRCSDHECLVITPDFVEAQNLAHLLAS
jgi:hypothetical protein